MPLLKICMGYPPPSQGTLLVSTDLVLPTWRFFFLEHSHFIANVNMNSLDIYYDKWILYKLIITHQQSSIRNLNRLKVSSFIYLGHSSDSYPKQCKMVKCIN